MAGMVSGKGISSPIHFTAGRNERSVPLEAKTLCACCTGAGSLRELLWNRCRKSGILIFKANWNLELALGREFSLRC